MSEPKIGIDLGTTFSCVAVVQHGKVEVIANDQGNRTTPSCVAFTDNELLVGEAAKNQAVRNPENTVFGVKRMIGRTFDDPELQKDIKLWPFKVINDKGEVKIEVKYKGETMYFVPEEISAMVLMKMKKTAEAYLGTTVKDAVITVPAYFNNSQRQATKNAGTIAGLNVIRILNEPTAAALAFGIDKKLEQEKTVLIFDLGGGTFDVSVMTVVKNDFKVHAVAGDTHLGGEDFDNILVDHVASDFKNKHNKDVSGSKKALLNLKTECEKAKRALSKCSKADVEIHPFYEGISLSCKITKSRFGELCVDKFKHTIDIVEKALQSADMEKSAIDEVVVVGGSTRIPKIRNLLQEFFDGKQLNMQVHADEAVACGAAVQADAMSGDTSLGIGKLLLLDVLPVSLGVKVRDHEYSILIEHNSRVPTCRTKTFKPQHDYQTSLLFQVFEGEHPVVQKNHLLGQFVLNGITYTLAAKTEILVTFDINTDGILNVQAMEKSTGHSKEITIKCLNSKGPADLEHSKKIVAMVDAEGDESDDE